MAHLKALETKNEISKLTIKDKKKRLEIGILSNIIPLSGLRQDAAKLLKQLQKDKDPIIIIQKGRVSAVLLGVEAYEEFEHEKKILRLLTKGEKEIEAGLGYDLDSVLAEADALISKEQL